MTRADRRDVVHEAFPEVKAITDDSLREGVLDAWTTAMTETDTDALRTVPWFPPDQRRLDIEDESLVDHVRDVVAAALVLADVLADRRESVINHDVLRSGALVHDVSKLYEFDGMDQTSVGNLLGHPHYGVYVAGAAGLPPEVVHVVLSHTPRTTVEPATLEAELVRRADEVAAAAIRATAVTDLREA